MTAIPIIDVLSSRYLHIRDMDQYNTDHQELFQFLVNQSRFYGRFANPDAYDEYLLGNTSDDTMTAYYDITAITNWNQLVYYMRLYLLRVISRTPFYDGPYSKETTYILPELLNINTAGVLTLDSEPGFFVQEASGIENSYIQLPYIQLLAPFRVIQNIINTAIIYRQNTPTAKFLAIASVNGQVSIDKTNDTLNKFPQLQLQERVASIFFSVTRPDPQDMVEFLDYIFTNTFFDDIVAIINIATQETG